MIYDCVDYFELSDELLKRYANEAQKTVRRRLQ